jgi:uncharacterized protein
MPERPQEPRGAPPYAEEQVRYENAAAHVRLAGTLTKPPGRGPHPAALLITGSGPHDRDETVAGHRPFLVLADYLTRRDIAVLRADDRGVGESTGDFAAAATDDFAADARAGFDFLRGRDDIDANRIGLIGHSDGAVIAPMLAAASADVAWIVMMAGPGVPGDRLLLAQADLIARAIGVPRRVRSSSRRLNQAIYAVVMGEPDDAAAQRKIAQVLEEHRGSLPDATLAAAEAQVARVTSPWFRSFLAHDPRPTLRRVKVPVLAVNGELDLQVPPRQNLPAIAAALEAGGNRDYAVVKLPRLNHLFQTARTGSPVEYETITETFAATALHVIGDWIGGHRRCA